MAQLFLTEWNKYIEKHFGIGLTVNTLFEVHVAVINARRYKRVIVISLFLSVCAPFRPYNSKTITSIDLKFRGQVFHEVQTVSAKFGVICLKIKVTREFFLIFKLEIHIETASLHHIRKQDALRESKTLDSI